MNTRYTGSRDDVLKKPGWALFAVDSALGVGGECFLPPCQTHAHTHTHTHTRAHTHAHAHIHTCMHARTHAHTRTHTYTLVKHVFWKQEPHRRPYVYFLP